MFNSFSPFLLLCTCSSTILFSPHNTILSFIHFIMFSKIRTAISQVVIFPVFSPTNKFSATIEITQDTYVAVTTSYLNLSTVLHVIRQQPIMYVLFSFIIKRNYRNVFLQTDPELLLFCKPNESFLGKNSTVGYCLHIILPFRICDRTNC